MSNTYMIFNILSCGEYILTTYGDKTVKIQMQIFEYDDEYLPS